jgi:hypothetical protein
MCRDITEGKDDPEKEQQEVRIRMAFIARKYSSAISAGKAA